MPTMESAMPATMRKSDARRISFHIRPTKRFTQPKLNDLAKSCVIDARILSGVRSNIIAKTSRKMRNIITTHMTPATQPPAFSLAPAASVPISTVGMVTTQTSGIITRLATNVTRNGQRPRSRYLPKWEKSKSGKAS